MVIQHFFQNSRPPQQNPSQNWLISKLSYLKKQNKTWKYEYDSNSNLYINWQKKFPWVSWFWTKKYIPYTRHYNLLLINNHSWILTVQKARILRKKLLRKSILTFKKWVEKIQTAGHNGTRAVTYFDHNHWRNSITALTLIYTHCQHSRRSLYISQKACTIIFP